MFQLSQLDLARFEHNHGGGEWHEMREVTDPADTDPERRWSRGRIFRCTTCEDEIRIEVPEPGANAGARTDLP